MRQIFLDTETTGLEVSQGHRLIEVAAIEMLNRQRTGKFVHFYLNPDRAIDEGAMRVHGISNEFLKDKPKFRAIAEELLSFIKGSELVIHNAPFDLGFINKEFLNLDKQWAGIESHCSILDTMVLARGKHRGARNSLDALCKRYKISNAHRTFHGALLDSELLADVYLAMTGGQINLWSEGTEQSELSEAEKEESEWAEHHEREHGGLYAAHAHSPGHLASGEGEKPIKHMRVILADESECLAHEAYLKSLDKSSSGKRLWGKETA